MPAPPAPPTGSTGPPETPPPAMAGPTIPVTLPVAALPTTGVNAGKGVALGL
jgi:hypothetical protein